MTTDQDDPGISILYVEDELDSRELLSKVIQHRFPEVRLLVSVNGKTGVELFKRYHPEIVITDINLPITDGIRMATEIKLLSSSTIIIALTAYTNIEYLLQAIEIGINQYILKPINFEQVFKAIDKALQMIRSSRLIVRQNDMIRDLNTRLVQKAAELELANQELESFSYTVAHDLRSSMVTIGGFSRKLLEMQDSKPDDASYAALQAINSESIRTDKLIDALLKLSIYSRKNVEKKWTDFTEIAHEIRDKLLAQDPLRQVDFCIGEGIKGYGDPYLMRIVLENLLGNSWKYTAKRDIARIEFGTKNREEDLVYFIRDNGVGFDPLESEKIFAPFHRLQNNEEFEGTGIGLATCFRIVQRHGGKIWAEGEKGKGTTFFFTL